MNFTAASVRGATVEARGAARRDGARSGLGQAPDVRGDGGHGHAHPVGGEVAVVEKQRVTRRRPGIGGAEGGKIDADVLVFLRAPQNLRPHHRGRRRRRREVVPAARVDRAPVRRARVVGKSERGERVAQEAMRGR